MALPDDPELPPPGGDPALHDALRELLAPLARLALARGVPFATLQDLLKEAFVRDAYDAHPELLPHRRVSRVSAATGINRREVARWIEALIDAEGAAAGRGPARSLPSEVFAHWRSDPAYRDDDGQPRELPRLGPAPSFEALAQGITRDVHPRTLLDELVRLELARWDPASDTVALQRDAFVPRADRARMLGFLGANVGDHLRAAVDNVLGDGRAHFEQAIFADGLSPASVTRLRERISAQWQRLSAEMVPELERLIAQDEAAGDAPPRRLRLGLYSFDDAAGPADPSTGPPAEPLEPAPRRAPRRRL